MSEGYKLLFGLTSSVASAVLLIYWVVAVAPSQIPLACVVAFVWSMLNKKAMLG
ncbi:MAG: hypothetical protein V3S43_06500 [Acidimicrobiia bacterium]